MRHHALDLAVELEQAFHAGYFNMHILAVITLDFTSIVVALIGAIVTITGVYYTYATAKLQTAVKDTNLKVDDLKEHVNSRMDKMIRALEEAAVAKGHLAGVEFQKALQATEEINRAKGVKEATKLEVDLKIPDEIKKKLDLP